MLKTDERSQAKLKPFVVAYAEDGTRPSKRSGQHLSKDKATKEVLMRLVKRVKAL